jgi:hypothetical protein
MKRYTIKTQVAVRCDYDMDQFGARKALAEAMFQENPDGEWVRYKDYAAMREHLEAQIPERRIAKLEKALGLVNAGKCPECEQKVRGYEPPMGSLAPEGWATLREHGIDPATGHKQGCSLS